MKLVIPLDQKKEIFFVTLTVKNWKYVFDRHDRWEILANALKYYMRNNNVKLYAFVFMLNHIHLIIQSPDSISFIRDFKRYVNKKVKQNIEFYEPSLLKHFKVNGSFNFWETTNAPKVIVSDYFYDQKYEYIHNNPVKKGYVINQEHWYWSSANEFCELKVNAWYE